MRETTGMEMLCSEAEPLLSELAGASDRDLAPEAGMLELLRAAQGHAARCAACGPHLLELTATVARLRDAGALALPAGFTRDLHRRLVAEGAPPLPRLARLARWSRHHPLRLALSSAAISGALAVVGTLLLLGRPTSAGGNSGNFATRFAGRAAGAGPSGGAGATLGEPPVAAPALPQFSIPAAKVALVKIDFDSQRDIADVDFEIQLPEGLHFYSSGQELAARSFQWHGQLNAGANVLPIAVKGRQAGRYRVWARAQGADLDVAQEVLLEVKT